MEHLFPPLKPHSNLVYFVLWGRPHILHQVILMVMVFLILDSGGLLPRLRLPLLRLSRIAQIEFLWLVRPLRVFLVQDSFPRLMLDSACIMMFWVVRITGYTKSQVIDMVSSLLQHLPVGLGMTKLLLLGPISLATLVLMILTQQRPLCFRRILCLKLGQACRSRLLTRDSDLRMMMRGEPRQIPWSMIHVFLTLSTGQASTCRTQILYLIKFEYSSELGR